MWTQLVLSCALVSSGDSIAWQKDLTAAEQAAREQKKPLLVVFRCER